MVKDSAYIFRSAISAPDLLNSRNIIVQFGFAIELSELAIDRLIIHLLIETALVDVSSFLHSIRQISSNQNIIAIAKIKTNSYFL